MNTPQRTLAFLAYLLSILGWIIAWLFGRRDRFVVYHLKQSVALLLFLLVVTVGWAVIAWLTGWVPFLFLFGMGLFSLVIAAFAFAVIAWVIGMRNALRGRMAPLPIIGGWARRFMP